MQMSFKGIGFTCKRQTLLVLIPDKTRNPGSLGSYRQMYYFNNQNFIQ